MYFTGEGSLDMVHEMLKMNVIVEILKGQKPAKEERNERMSEGRSLHLVYEDVRWKTCRSRVFSSDLEVVRKYPALYHPVPAGYAAVADGVDVGR